MVELAGLQVEGISLGGIETCIQIPEYKLALDIGRCPLEAIQLPTVLISHPHTDHLAGIVSHCATRNLRHMPPPTYVVPAECLEKITELFVLWRQLDGSKMPCRLLSLTPGETHTLQQDLQVSSFHAPHPGPAQGYILSSVRRKLRREYLDLPGTEIARRRAAGEDLIETIVTPEVAYTGDSTFEPVLENEEVRRARRLILEVTFLDDRVSPENARRMGHVHIDEVVEHADLFENEALLFVHFSSRYGAEEARDLVERKLPAGLRERVEVLVG
jgi:ribonuclease Z